MDMLCTNYYIACGCFFLVRIKYDMHDFLTCQFVLLGSEKDLELLRTDSNLGQVVGHSPQLRINLESF